MDLNLAKTKNIMDEIGGGTLFDNTLSGSIGSLGGGIKDAVNVLKSSNIPDIGPIASEITANLDPAALGDLASHVEENIGSTMEKLSTFNSFCSVKDALSGAISQKMGELPEVLPNNPAGDLAPIAKKEAGSSTTNPPASAANALLGKAFGAMLAARSMVSSVAAIKDSVTKLASLEVLVTTATGALTEAAADHAKGAITSGELSRIREAKEEAESKLGSAKAGITNMARDLSTNLGSVRTKIAEEKAFFEGATGELTRFADAMKIQSMFSGSPASQAVMGALGSPSLLSKLRDVN